MEPAQQEQVVAVAVLSKNPTNQVLVVQAVEVRVVRVRKIVVQTDQQIQAEAVVAVLAVEVLRVAQADQVSLSSVT